MTSKDSSNIDDAVPESIRNQVDKAKGSQILGWEYPYKAKMKRDEYEKTKLELQIELLKLENWIKAKGERSSYCSRVGMQEAKGARSRGSWNI